MRVLVGAMLAVLPLLGAVGVPGISGASHAAPEACPAPSAGASDYEIALLHARVNVPRGGVIELPVCIARAAGFEAPVRVRLEMLPPGVDAAPLVVPAHATSGLLRIAASRRANAGAPQDAVLVGAGFGRVHTAPVSISVIGARDSGPSDPNEDEGKRAVAMLSSAR